ncbi:VAMP-like protein [Musa troglodytarum]|uniref:VAMP-like protein n=1 Tax=Musa troglodytarum TaxID=320322 RepID=A0A9E7FBK3_9LILI|nr:VAMP-like protein [Musa troglodytarum]
MIPVPDPHPILYACVAHGTTILAELSFAEAGGGGDGDLSLGHAAGCLATVPRFHRHYSHTAGGRIYAFLMAEPLVFFAIADEAVLGKPRALLFLRRLRDAFSSSAVRRRRTAAGGDGSDPLPHLCLQEDFLPELHRLVQSVPSQDEEPPPPRPCLPPPAASPRPSDSDEDQKVKEKKGGKGKRKMTISVVNRDVVDSDPANGGSKSVQKVWRQHVRTIILIDLVVCCFLLGVWVSICRGFECITN